MGRWGILNGVLALIVLLLGLQIARTWSRTLPPVETVARATDPGPKDQDKPDGKTGGGRRGGKRGANEKADPQPTVLVATIVNKDLFDPSRQKPSEEVKAPPPKEIGPPPNLTLVGVRMIGKDHEIFVTDAGQANQQKRLRIGDQLGGYTLKTIQPSKATLAAASGDVVTLTLAVDKSGGGAATTPGAPRPPGAPARPGQPAAPASPAAGGASPAAGVTARQPRGPGARPGRPGAPGTPGAPGSPAAAPSPAAGVPQPQFAAPAAPSGPPAAGMAPQAIPPNLPAAVREKLEQLKGN